MSTVLTKPVLLDETGQAIVGKLQDIQQAIGGTGEFIPINIRVTTPPTKTNYLAGEALDLSGMVVTLVANNGGMYDVTGDCVFSPADGSTVTSSTTEVSISYTWYKDSTVFTAVQPISIKALTSIAVTTPPTVTEYIPGETLDLTGIVVTATFNDSTTENVTSQCVFSPADGATLSMGDDTVSISYTLGTTTATTTQAISVKYPIYGVEWEGTSSPKFARTDSAVDFTDPIPQMSDGNGGWTQGSSPFDNISPWKDIEIVEDAEAGTMVKIPKFYYKWTKDGLKMKLQISPMPLDGFLVSPAHMDRGDGKGERDIVYVGRYHCSADSFNNYKSYTGVAPRTTETRQTFRTNIAALGTEVWQLDYAMVWTINMLLLVEIATWDAQSAIGKGGPAGSGAQIQGGTDAMTYHTGTDANDLATHGNIQYRHIENWWGNVNDWVDGIRFNDDSLNGDTYIIKNPSLFHDTSRGQLVGQKAVPTPYSGVVKEWTIPSESGYEWALLPAVLVENNDFDTYSCDSVSVPASGGQVLHFGGNTNAGNGMGPFKFGCTYGYNITMNFIGGRPMKLPNNS